MSNQVEKPDTRGGNPDKESLAGIGWTLASVTLAAACVAALLVAREHRSGPFEHGAPEPASKSASAGDAANADDGIGQKGGS
jgi:hypothetical protein